MELKPCPFCGLKPVVINGKPNLKSGQYSVVCKNLGCPMLMVATYSRDTESEVIEAWNTRTGDAE